MKTEYNIGHRLPIDISSDRPFIVLLRVPHFDDTGYQRAERINGAVECPDCGLWWPLVEEIVEWIERPEGPKEMWFASGWDTGSAWCSECDILLADGFDGCYVIRPPKESSA